MACRLGTISIDAFPIGNLAPFTIPFLAALQVLMSMDAGEAVLKYFSAFQLIYQNKSCSECQQDIKKTDLQTDRKTFQLSYQNINCSECQQDVKKSIRQTGR